MSTFANIAKIPELRRRLRRTTAERVSDLAARARERRYG